MIGQNSPGLLSILKRDDLTPTEKLAWVALCEIQASDSDRGSLYRRLAETMGLTGRYDGGREAVKRAITSLRSKGLVGRTFIAIDPTSGLFIVSGVETTPSGVKNTPMDAETTPLGVKNTPIGAENASILSSSSSSSSPYRGGVGGDWNPSTALGPVDFVEPFQRDPDDLAAVKVARDRLANSLNHQALAMQLEGSHETTENREVAGWQWAAAAVVLVERKKVARLGYLRAIAQSMTAEEADKIERKSKARPIPASVPTGTPSAEPLDVSEITDEMEAKFGTWVYTRSFAKAFRQHNGNFAAILQGGE